MSIKTLLRQPGFLLLLLCTLIVLGFLGLIIADISLKGGEALSWPFVSGYPRDGMTAGGIFPAIFGTFFVTVVTTLFALPLGVAAA
ncbi:MAG: phosphate ABC transporter, permease protein PstA, partial [Bacteroidetes bacterium]|nr:phosphate ABC transporter, permease protein PstA [Bacteroidota bacterium]